MALSQHQQTINHWNSGFGDQVFQAIQVFKEANFSMAKVYRIWLAQDSTGLPGINLDVNEICFSVFTFSYPCTDLSILILGPNAEILFRDRVINVDQIHASLNRGVQILQILSDYKTIRLQASQRLLQ